MSEHRDAVIFDPLTGERIEGCDWTLTTKDGCIVREEPKS